MFQAHSHIFLRFHDSISNVPGCMCTISVFHVEMDVNVSQFQFSMFICLMSMSHFHIHVHVFHFLFPVVTYSMSSPMFRLMYIFPISMSHFPCSLLLTYGRFELPIAVAKKNPISNINQPLIMNPSRTMHLINHLYSRHQN